MEPIRDILNRLDSQKNIPHPLTTTTSMNPTSEDEPEKLTPEQQKEAIRLNLWLSSADHIFDNFKTVMGTKQSYKAVKDLAEGKATYQMVLIYGGVGNGKTYLCEAASLYLHQHGIICRVLTWPDIIRALKRCMEPTSEKSMQELIDHYCNTKYLIIDDIGAGMSGSEFGMKELEEIVVYRYHNHFFTIMTSNKDISGLPERVISRFNDKEFARLVLNDGSDYRLKK